MTTINLQVPGGTMSSTMSAYVVMPAGDAPCPAVVMIHDILGNTNDYRRQADWMASEGYLVIAPDLFDGGNIMGCVRSVVTHDMNAGEGELFERLEVARQWLLQHERCTGKVGVVGFCLGGGFALLLAPKDQYDAAASMYPSMPKNLDQVLKGACPVIASFGGSDPLLKNGAAKLEKILVDEGIEHDVKEYPGCGHDFMSNRYDDKIPFLIKVVAWAVGSKPNAAAAEDSRKRISDFFAKYLKATVPA